MHATVEIILDTFRDYPAELLAKLSTPERKQLVDDWSDLVRKYETKSVLEALPTDFMNMIKKYDGLREEFFPNDSVTEENTRYFPPPPPIKKDTRSAHLPNIINEVITLAVLVREHAGLLPDKNKPQSNA